MTHPECYIKREHGVCYHCFDENLFFWVFCIGAIAIGGGIGWLVYRLGKALCSVCVQ